MALWTGKLVTLPFVVGKGHRVNERLKMSSYQFHIKGKDCYGFPINSINPG